MKRGAEDLFWTFFDLFCFFLFGKKKYHPATCTLALNFVGSTYKKRERERCILTVFGARAQRKARGRTVASPEQVSDR